MNKRRKNIAIVLSGALAVFALCFCIFAAPNFSANNYGDNANTKNNDKAYTATDNQNAEKPIENKADLPKTSQEVFSGHNNHLALESPTSYLANAMKVVTEEDKAKQEEKDKQKEVETANLFAGTNPNANPAQVGSSNANDLAWTWDDATKTVKVGTAANHTDWTPFDSHGTAGWHEAHRYNFKTLEVVEDILPFSLRAWGGCIDQPKGGEVRLSSLRNIKGFSKIYMNNLVDISFLFAGCKHLTINNDSGWETFCSRITAKEINAYAAFALTSNITNQLYQQIANALSGATNLSFVFAQNSNNLTSFPQLKYSNCEDFSYMFIRDNSLNLRESSFLDTVGNSAKDISGMFAYCFNNDQLVNVQKELDISGWSRENAEEKVEGVFYGCKNLVKIYVNEFADWRNASSGTHATFEGCENLIGGDGTTYSDTTKTATYTTADSYGHHGLFTYGGQMGDTFVTLKYCNNDAEESPVYNIEPQKVHLGDSFTVQNGLDDPDHEIWQTFLGWSTTKDAKTADYIKGAELPTDGMRSHAVIKLYPVIVNNKYTVQFNMQGHGTAPAPQTVAYGEKVTKPTDPTEEGYIFGGWYKDQACTTAWNFDTDTVSGDTLINAKWTPIKYKVRFNSSGGQGTMQDQNLIYDYSQPLTLNTFTKTGYKFKGWDLKESATEVKYGDGEWVEKLTTQQGDIVNLYAVWSPNTYTMKGAVAQDQDGWGTVSEDITEAYGTSFTVSGDTITFNDGKTLKASPTTGDEHYDYAFASWDRSSGTVTGDMTFTASFSQTPKNYTVQFDMQGHGTQISPQTVAYGGKVTKPTDPTAEGYKFEGWFKNAECTNAWNFDTDTVTENTTLYAHWTKTYKATYVVSLWGAKHQGDSGVATFGPATGPNTSFLDHTCGSEHCIHNDSWQQIKENLAKDPSCYDKCISEGCTKTIELNLNDTIASKSTLTYNPSSILYYSINSNYLKWNFRTNTNDPECANWSTSRLRATLNGKTGMSLSEYAYPEGQSAEDNDCLDSDNCLLSCFPTDLKNMIVSKTYNVATQWNKSGNFDITNQTQVSDKLWLPNTDELYSTDPALKFYDESALKDSHSHYATRLDKYIPGGLKFNNTSFNYVRGYHEQGQNCPWWVRCPIRKYYDRIGGIHSNDPLANSILGLPLCFCL